MAVKKPVFTVKRADLLQTLDILASDDTLDVLCCDPRAAAQHRHGPRDTLFHIRGHNRTYCVDSHALAHIAVSLLRTHGGCGLVAFHRYISQSNILLPTLYIEETVYTSLSDHMGYNSVVLNTSIRTAVAAAALFWTCARERNVVGGRHTSHAFVQLTRTLSAPAIDNEKPHVRRLRAYYEDGVNAVVLWKHVEAERVMAALLHRVFRGCEDVDEWRAVSIQQPCVKELTRSFVPDNMDELYENDEMVVFGVAERLRQIITLIDSTCADCTAVLFRRTPWFMVDADVTSVMKPFAPLCKVVYIPPLVGQALLCASAVVIQAWQQIHAITAGSADDGAHVFSDMLDIITSTTDCTGKDTMSAHMKRAVLLRIHDSIVGPPLASSDFYVRHGLPCVKANHPVLSLFYCFCDALCESKHPARATLALLRQDTVHKLTRVSACMLRNLRRQDPLQGLCVTAEEDVRPRCGVHTKAAGTVRRIARGREHTVELTHAETTELYMWITDRGEPMEWRASFLDALSEHVVMNAMQSMRGCCPQRLPAVSSDVARRVCGETARAVQVFLYEYSPLLPPSSPTPASPPPRRRKGLRTDMVVRERQSGANRRRRHGAQRPRESLVFQPHHYCPFDTKGSVSVELVNVAYAAALQTTETPLSFRVRSPIPIPLQPQGLSSEADAMQCTLAEMNFCDGNMAVWEQEANALREHDDWRKMVATLNKTTCT